MMKTGGKAGALAQIVPALAFALIISRGPALAQSASEFQLPRATPSAAPRGQGPVDPENPGASAPRPGGTASPAPSQQPSASPTPSATAAPAATPSSSAARSVRRPALRPNPVPAAPIPSPSAAPLTLPAPTPGITATSFPSLTQASPPSRAETAPASGTATWWWFYLAGGAAALAALFALLWRRKRGIVQVALVEFEMPVVAVPTPAPAPAPAPSLPLAIPEPQLSAAVAPAPAPEPAPEPAQQGDGLVLMLEATRLSASLLATTLSYRLRLTNHGALPLAGLAIEGDMVSAHASLPPEQQMAQARQKLELRHVVATLDPGETAEFSGDIRLPLSAITPLRAGEQAYFVPLARFRVEAGAPGGDGVVIAQTFVVGDVPDGPQTTLRPFRLDLGPRTYSRISQREVT